MEVWYEFGEMHDRVVAYDVVFRFPNGVEVREPNQLVFRSDEEVRGTLADAGFEIEHVYGDWDKGPPSRDCTELIYIARTSPSVA